MRSRVLLACIAALWTQAAAASSINVAFSSDGSDCDGQVPPFTPFTTYALALLGGDAAASGIVGAEFRLAGYDPAWLNTVVPSPIATASVGNPIAEGCNIGFSMCQPGTASVVLLYTIQSIALAPISPRTLAVLPHLMPNPNFDCPTVLLCNGPHFTRICVAGGEAGLNRTTCFCCPAVEPRSWSGVKALYAQD